MFVVILTTLLSLTTALQWTDSLTNNTVMTVCSASDIHLPWNFTLSPDERVEVIKWNYQAEDGSEKLIAVYLSGVFAPMPAFSGRVQWTGQGGIVVSHAQSGQYTVSVRIGDVAHPLVTFSKSVSVQVADPPTAENDELHVLQRLDAVLDSTTGQWRVQLTCGLFTDLGHPAVHVVWTTPEGHTVQSSSEHNGTFRLLLPNPPYGGNYTCTLPPLSPATRCLPPLSPLLEGATVTVDEVKVSVTLVEIRQRETEARLEAVQNETAILQARLATARRRVSFHATLTSDFNNSGTLHPFTVITDEGDAFNGTSGVFTAPWNGTYFFVASAGTWASEKWVNMWLERDGVGVSQAITQQYSSYYAMGSVQATLSLAQDQQVWLRSDDATGYYYAGTTSFTGFLVRADD